MTPFMHNETVELQPLSWVDAQRAAAWRNDPRVRIRTREFRALTQAHQERWQERINALGSPHHMFAVRRYKAVVSEESNPVVAVVGLCHWDARDRTAETSFYLTDSIHERQGYMTAALSALHEWGFSELGLDKIWAEVYAFNRPAVTLLTKLGFKEEGRLRQHVWRLNQRVDSIMLGLLRQEWEERT